MLRATHLDFRKVLCNVIHVALVTLTVECSFSLERVTERCFVIQGAVNRAMYVLLFCMK